MGQSAIKQTDVEFPKKLGFLFEPHRYKVCYGGRGGAKSWSIARALLLLAADRPLRVLCCREFQKSIKDSVHKLLSDQIVALELDRFFTVQQATIKGANGSEFFFEGLKHNTANIKSYEAVNLAWVEEAHLVSKTSWEILIPTIRAEGSEIWISFNPELLEDETYQRFVVSPPSSAKVVKVNWSDNPWFPEVLRNEMQELRKKDPDAWLNIWEGNCREILEGAIYANELRQAKEDGRICKVNYDTSKPVNTFWDLGWSDNTSIWFAQSVGMQYRVIDFYQNSLQPLQHYLQLLQGRGYVYGKHYLPHDARAKQLGTGRSIQEQMEAAGLRIEIVPQLSIVDGINAARSVFNVCWFDAEKCAEGLNSLRHYRYDLDADTGRFSKVPLHDWASHAADAFRYLGVAIKGDAPRRRLEAPMANQSWLGL